MLPTNSKKLLMKWKGPYKIIQTMGDHDHKILVRNRVKEYHEFKKKCLICLKKYYAREDKAETGNEKRSKNSSQGGNFIRRRNTKHR